MRLPTRIAEAALAPLVNADQARRSILLSALDWAAVGAAGQGEPVAQIVRNVTLAQGGAPQAAVFGALDAAPARAAAMINGVTSHALDYDDTHFAHVGHPSVVVWSAVMAQAQAMGAGRDVTIDAALIGAEVSVRIGQWLGAEHYNAGFHQTATAGAFGAVVGVGRLLGLTVTQLAHAINLMATRASGLKSQFGTMGKPYNAGLAAANAVEVAHLAQAGMQGPKAGLEGPQGFGPTHAGAGDNSAFDTLGQAWRFPAVSYKFHACCHGIHATLEAAKGYVGPAQVAINPRWAKVCNIGSPTTGLEVKFSLAHVLAMQMAGIDTGALVSYDDAVCQSQPVLELRAGITVVFDPEVSDTAAVVQTPQGTLHHDLSQQVSLEVLQDKLQAKAQALVCQTEAAHLLQSIAAADMPQAMAVWMASTSRSSA